MTALFQSASARQRLLLLTIALVGLVPGCSQTRSRALEQAELAFSACFPPGGPGGVALVAVAGRTVFREAYGLADLERLAGVRPGQPFPLGSVTKQFVAAAILRLADRGEVRLEDRVGSYVDGLPEPVACVTIAELLSHTSGLTDYVTEAPPAAGSGGPIDPRSLVDSVASRPLLFEPGSDWAYSNTNYALLGLLIERVTAESCGDFLERELFAPSGLDSTTFGPPAEPPPLVGYEMRGGRYIAAQGVDPSWSYAAGAVWSSVDDLARWNESLAGGRVISPLALARMMRPTALASGQMAPYGFGWRTGRLDRYTLLWHDGAVPGFFAIVLYVPERRIFVAVVSNGGADRDDIDRAAREVASYFAAS